MMRSVLGYYIDPRGDGRIETLCEGLPAQSNNIEYEHWDIVEHDGYREVRLLIDHGDGEMMVDESCVLWDNYFSLLECIRNNDCEMCAG